ncbi:MAG: DNA circularization N-terminal domain-containing protein [Deltaproteobacteria bacterium]|nr:DNA circularization N-terminal domain-containing protein [Deltaproteobacteria bacterium]
MDDLFKDLKKMGEQITAQGQDIVKDLQKQGQGMSAKIPGMANDMKAQMEPALIQMTGMGKGLVDQMKPAAENMSRSVSKAMPDLKKSASAVSSAAASIIAVPKAIPDAARSTMPSSPVAGELIQPMEGMFNGLSLEMETIEDTFEKAIAQYDYPYADGVDLEDMGQKAHKLRMRCYFYDNAEQKTYGYHILLLNDLASRDLIDLMHPKYGLLEGKIESFIVQHDDRQRCAVVDIVFVEQMRATYEGGAPPLYVQAKVETAFSDGQKQQAAKLASDIKAALPPPDKSIIEKILDRSKALLAQVQEYSNKTRAFVGAVEGYIATSEAIVNQVMSPVNSLQATISYAENLPGRILGSNAGIVERVALLYTSLKNFPTRFIKQLDSAFDDMLDSLTSFNPTDPTPAKEIMATHLEIACAQRLALEAAQIYAADDDAFRGGSGEKSVGMVYANADQAAEESSGSISTSSFQIMNIQELEETLAIVRNRIERAVAKAREMDSLKQMAEALLIQVNRVRLERERMMKVVLDNPMPLHLVCLKYGLPYTDAERLLKVNRIRNPNFTAGEVYVYA